MYINPSWKFKEVIPKLKTLKTEYDEVLASFYFVLDRNNYIREIKQQVYSLSFDENKIDHVWEYMNDDLTPLQIYFIFGLEVEEKRDEENIKFIN